MAISSLPNSHADLDHITSHNIRKAKAGDKLKTNWNQRQNRQPIKLKNKLRSKPYSDSLSIKNCTSQENSLCATSMHYDPGKNKAHRTVTLVTVSLFAWVSQKWHVLPFFCTCYSVHMKTQNPASCSRLKRLTKSIIIRVDYQFKTCHFSAQTDFIEILPQGLHRRESTFFFFYWLTSDSGLHNCLLFILFSLQGSTLKPDKWH